MSASTSTLSHAPHLRTIIESALHFSAEEPEVFVFGYGSLIWHAGFEYTTSTRAYLTGWARRFYHGNVTFRGTVEKVRILV
jgi:cation transport regulator ChaC